MARFKSTWYILAVTSLIFTLNMLSGCRTPEPTKTVTPDANGVYTTETPYYQPDTAVPTRTKTQYGYVSDIHEWISVDDLVLVVDTVDFSTNIKKLPSRDGFVFLSCFVNLDNSGRSLAVGPENFRVTDNQHNVFSTIPWPLDPALASGILGPHKQTHGYLLFEVPVTATNLQLGLEVTVTTHITMTARLGR